MEKPKLFKKNSKGIIQEWAITLEDLNGSCKITIIYGRKNGKKNTKIDMISSGKNIGRKNETSYMEQGIKEMESRYRYQIDRKGYSENPAGQSNPYSPMLAHKYSDHSDKINWPAYVQPKYDGLRCVAVVKDNDVELISRKNKNYVLPHISRTLLTMFPAGTILDGELYNHDIPINDINSFVKKENHPRASEIQYHIYDEFTRPNEPYQQRMQFVNFIPQNNIVLPAKTYLAHTHDDLINYHDEFVLDGFEGAIVRNADAPYKIDGRSYDLLKFKKFEDGEFEIVGVTENEKMPGTGVINLITKEGYPFKSMPVGTQEQRAEYLTNAKDIIGKMGTVRYFCMTKTDKPVPFHGVFVCVRED